MASSVQDQSGPLPASGLAGSNLHQSGVNSVSLAAGRNNGTSLMNTMLPGPIEFDLPSFNADFKLDAPFLSNSAEPRPATQPSPLPPTEATSALESKLLRRPSLARAARSSIIDRPRSWIIPGSKSAVDVANARDQSSSSSPSAVDDKPAAATTITVTDVDTRQLPISRLERSNSVSDSFVSFARRSWIGASSRSPSPKSKREQSAYQAPPASAGLSRLSSVRKSNSPHRLQVITTIDENDQPKGAESLKPTPRPFIRASSYLSKMKPKQQNTFLSRDGAESDHSCDSSATSLGNRTSNSFGTSASQSISSDGNTSTPITDDAWNETPPKLRDPLWSAFKMLEVGVNGLGSKQNSLRTAQVHSVLLPFLRSTTDHPSNKIISLEDVERRAIIFNRWWVLVLDMLHGNLSHSLSAMDRTILLEAATMLMMRPEWRQSTTYLQPLAERSPLERVRSRSWTNTSKSTADSSVNSDLFTDSAEHNIRTMFVTNLVRQMAHVVERMSLRHAPLSLVNFSAKTCAYAFFFAPGVADVLVRLWGLTPDLIRRTGIELGLPLKDLGESDDIIALFPPNLGLFGWTSPRTVWDSLKNVPKMSLPVARIPWTGPWVARWKGRDTDLFFIFCKYFHVLSDQFIPPGLPLTEKARSPGFALVHAQLLSLLDSTIHRQAAMQNHYGTPVIDSFHGADAAALSIPLPPSNLMRCMAENRLVVLLKDVLSENAPDLSSARHTFAETFATLMKATANKTSLYNGPACFTLCDFLEEVLMIYHQFETLSTCYVDWPFWIDVCKRMSTSMNTLSEVRMLSFIFTIWDAVASDSRRKATVCLEWLLTEEAFNAFFNNWCPMVRAYYQRLVCWRMCRYTGGSNEMDLNIYLTAAARLKLSWAHYLFLKQEADEHGRSPPSTAPMSPAMGKRFMIVRQEVNSPQKGLFMGSDAFARLPPHQLLDDSPGTNGLARKDPKKQRWSLLGRVLAITSGNNMPQASANQDPKELRFAENDTPTPRREVVDSARPKAASPQQRLNRIERKASPSEEDLEASPVFDEQKYIFKFVLGWQQSPGPPRERPLTKPQLPVLTQARVNAKAGSIRASLSASSPTPRTSVQSPPDTPKPLLTRSCDDLSSVTASVEEWLKNTPTGDSAVGEIEGGRESNAQNLNNVVDELSLQNLPSLAGLKEGSKEKVTKPIKPTKAFVKNAVYSGRALAEWSQVVSECNIFTERRQQDGVERLCDIEVPFLGVEGFRKLGV